MRHRLVFTLLLALALPAAGLAATPPANAPAPAKPAAAFDARDPRSLIAVLEGMNAKAAIDRTEGQEVFLRVDAPGFSFAAQYAGCTNGKGCQGLAFSAGSTQRSSTLAQMNGFNQSSIACRVFEDSAGKAHVMYSTLLFASTTREDMRQHIGAWQGCLSTFGVFLSDPIAYLADAP